MNFCLSGASAASPEAKRELRILLPHLASMGHALQDRSNADVVLSYGAPLSDDDKNEQLPVVVRWDDSCDDDAASTPGLRSVIFGSRHEAGVWLEHIPHTASPHVCHGAVDLEDVVKQAPPGLEAVRSQFDKMLAASVSPGQVSQYVTAARRLSAGVVLVGDVWPGEVALASGRDVFYAEGLERADWLALLSLCSGVLCLQRTPSVPPIVLDALAQGTAVLHQDQPGILEVVGDMGHPWDVQGVTRKYPWDLSALSAEAASRIFSAALCG